MNVVGHSVHNNGFLLFSFDDAGDIFMQFIFPFFLDKVFTTFYLSMVRVGEMTGRLEEIFLRLFDHMEFERFMREQVKAALRYPSFVIAAMVVAMFVVSIWVIPAFAGVFKGFGAELPLLTRILIAVSNFMVNSWHVLIGGMVAVAFAFRTWVNTPAGRYTWDKFTLRP